MNQPLTANQIRSKYLDFFKQRGHVEIPPAPLVPENDPTTLFTSAGMQPLVPYLIGEPHPSGTRLVDSQPSFRAEDIEEVGDNRHTTFFEMLGNWSLGDYFKREQLRWFWTFLVDELGLDPQRLYVSVFSGDAERGIPRDEESVAVWKELFAEKGIAAKTVELITGERGNQEGMQGGRIFYYDARKNWWSRAGAPANMPPGEPGGPDSEVFYEFAEVPHNPRYGPHCHPNCDCGRFLEIGNSVFMQYIKLPDDTFVPLPKQNVDFGGGLERQLAAANDQPDIFRTDILWPIIAEIQNVTGAAYEANQPAMQVIADHIKAAVFMIRQGLAPGNKRQGYILRRLIRRAAVKLLQLQGGELELAAVAPLVHAVVGIYTPVYFSGESAPIAHTIEAELARFKTTLAKGLREIEKHELATIDGRFAFDLFQTYGFPFELTQELVAERGGRLDRAGFDDEFAKHQEQSRTASAGMFRGGLADQSENVVKYHTATHLLHAALRQLLGTHVQQKGSNITAERLRFDFTHPAKVSDEEIQQIQALINRKIEEDLPVNRTVHSYQEAIEQGALAFFGERYPEQVSVYTIGDPQGEWFSKELCGGPHVQQTGEIGVIKITREGSAAAGVRRIYAELA
jgi:alanyl-tRNA synthetase